MSAQNEAAKPTAAGLVTVSNVAEIFNAAGFAFKKLGELVQQLDQGSNDGATVNGGAAAATTPAATASNSLSHWETTDVEQFQSIITNFNAELSKLSNNLKNKMSARLQAEHTDKAMDRMTPLERESLKAD